MPPLLQRSLPHAPGQQELRETKTSHRHAPVTAPQLGSPSPPSSPMPSRSLLRQHKPKAVNTLPPSSSPAASGSVDQRAFGHEAARGRSLNYDDLSRYFHLPINTAARELGVCVTALKKQCRKHGVPRWPHRKLKSLDKLKEKLEKEEATAADKEYYKHEIHSIVQKKDHIFRASQPNREMSSSGDFADSTTPATPAPSDSHQNLRLRDGSVGQEQNRSHPLHPMQMTNHIPVQVRTPNMGRPHPQALNQGLSSQVLGGIPMPPTHVGMCGIIGCDCYMNGGVSSPNYHPPFPRAMAVPASNSPIIAPSGRPTLSAGMPTDVNPFYGAAVPHYAYPGPIAYPGSQQQPFHNMVQVNLMEQQAYPHHPGGSANSSQPQAINTHAGKGLMSAGATGSPSLMQGGPMPTHSSGMTGPINVTPAPGFEMYGQPVAPGQHPSGLVYGSFPTQGPQAAEGAKPASQSNGSPQMVPHYWTEMQHAQNPNNLVTMYNQTTHYHHHHVADLGGHGRSVAGRMGDGTASTITHNSDVGISGKLAMPNRCKSGPGIPTKTEVMGAEAVTSRSQPTIRSRNPVRLGVGMLPETGGLKPNTQNLSTGVSPEGNHSTVIGSSARRQRSPRANLELNSSSKRERKAGNGKTSLRIKVPKEGERNASRISGGKLMDVASHGVRSECLKETAKHDVVEARDGDFLVEGQARTSVHDSRPDERQLSPEADQSRSEREAPKSPPIPAVAEQPTGFMMTEAVASRVANGCKRAGIELKSGTGRSPGKRPRSANMDKKSEKPNSWGQSYITAGNTGVPILRGNRETSADQIREITPPSDREETPEDQGDGSGSGSGTGPGSGSGLGSREGSGSGSRDGEGNGSGSGFGDSDETKVLEDAAREVLTKREDRERRDPSSPPMNGARKSENQPMSRAPFLSDKEAGLTCSAEGGGTEDRCAERAGGNIGSGASGGGGNASTRARRYEHVVHQCVSLLCAQWCTDKHMRVTLSVGSKMLLTLAGVHGHGSVYDDADGMLESRHTMRCRYASAAKGQRVEWICTHGRKRFLMILGPFRTRSSAEILGVTGMVVELTQGGEIGL